MLTLEDLEKMEPVTVFATGTTVDSPEGIHMTGSGRPLRWVACRGAIPDWTIYVFWADRDVQWIKRFGDKVHMAENIRRTVPCTDEAFKMYRY